MPSHILGMASQMHWQKLSQTTDSDFKVMLVPEVKCNPILIILYYQPILTSEAVIDVFLSVSDEFLPIQTNTSLSQSSM